MARHASAEDKRLTRIAGVRAGPCGIASYGCAAPTIGRGEWGHSRAKVGVVRGCSGLLGGFGLNLH